MSYPTIKLVKLDVSDSRFEKRWVMDGLWYTTLIEMEVKSRIAGRGEVF